MTWARIAATVCASSIALICITPAQEAVGADPLKQLRAVMNDEAAALDALLTYDNVQQDLFDWDIEMARELAKEGDNKAARIKADDANARLASVRKAYMLFLSYHPNNAAALNGYAELLFHRLGEQDSAIMHWQRAASASDDEPLCRANLANFYGHTGNYALMVKYMDEALEIGENNPDVLFYMSQLHFVHFPQIAKIKEWDIEKVYKEGMKLSRKAADLAPADHQLQEDYAVNFYAASNFGINADWKEAAKAWERARVASYRDEDLFFAWLNMARVNTMIGDWAEAMRCVDEAIKIIPDNDSALRVKEMIGNEEPIFREEPS